MQKIPISTYRLQFHGGFTFDDAANLSTYLAGLGISDLYASPCFQAVPGSAHGYDVVDFHRVDEALGGKDGYEKLCQNLLDNNLGCIQDMVPNHMAMNSRENVWWWDVLEHGCNSRYAPYFDIDWGDPENKAHGKILIPVLGDHYGRVLEAREIQLRNEHGRFIVSYYENEFPIAPHTLGDLLEEASRHENSDELAFLGDALRSFSKAFLKDQKNLFRSYRNMAVVRKRLGVLLGARPETARALDAVIRESNGDVDRLDALLEAQHYRLVFWKTATREMGFRRFFDVNTLVGLRIEDERVFEDTHRLILQWIKKGTVRGLRIDHIDGLRDPEKYLCRLHEAAPDVWVVAEKILLPGEYLPATWPVAGTTGYDFMNLVGELFVDPNGERPLTDFYAEFTGESDGYHAVVRRNKHRVIKESLGAEINRLTTIMMQICSLYRRCRDFGCDEVHSALCEVIACFPVYRTYVMPYSNLIREEDEHVIQEAVRTAKGNKPDMDPELFDFLQRVLLRDCRGGLETELVMRFQQTTGPITAKGVEDTAFYCFNRFISLNEVGGDPSIFGISVETFHKAMAERAKRYPRAMLATSTHDTKRSEDIRARLSLLSEIPERWMTAVRQWSWHNEQYRRDDFPDRNAEYFLYQTLVGAWPIGEERLTGHMQKAVKEAKIHTSWIHPDPEYENTVSGFIRSVLSDPKFVSDLQEFVLHLIHPGRINSLSQTLIKLTAPGIPDIYQGTELWDLSLVDPDNRRPVDFEMRRRLLSEIQDATPELILNRMDEGMPKLWVIRHGLDIRKGYHRIFASSNYSPLFARGEKSSHVVAFSRGEAVLTVVPRLILGLNGKWGDTSLAIPEGRWHNAFTNEDIRGGQVMMTDLFRRFPVALLVRHENAI